MKALYQALHMEAWGYVVHELLRRLPSPHTPPEELVDADRRLDRFHIPARYPDGFAAGAPCDVFTAGDARSASADAEAIVAFCADRLP